LVSYNRWWLLQSSSRTGWPLRNINFWNGSGSFLLRRFSLSFLSPSLLLANLTIRFIWLSCLTLWFSWSQILLSYLAFQSINFERTWWRFSRNWSCALNMISCFYFPSGRIWVVVLFVLVLCIVTNVACILIIFMTTTSVFSNVYLIWDRHNLFEWRRPLILRGRREKGMHNFFSSTF
jgi:hypothetical protein